MASALKHVVPDGVVSLTAGTRTKLDGMLRAYIFQKRMDGRDCGVPILPFECRDIQVLLDVRINSLAAGRVVVL